MACIKLAAITGEVALTANIPRTVVQILAPTNQRLRLLRWGVSFDGVSVTAEPVVVKLVRQSTAGTMTSLTLVKTNPNGSETIQTNGYHSATSTEPTLGDVLDVQNIHPQTGYDYTWLITDDFEVPGAGRVGIQCTLPVGATGVNVIGKLYFEE